MKRIIKCLICLMLFSLLLPAAAYADDTRNYTFPELGLMLKIPAGLIVLTRGMDSQDPELKRSGFTLDEWAKEYAQSSYYMRAIGPKWAYDITLSQLTSNTFAPYVDLGIMSDTDLQSEVDSTRSYYSGQGVKDLAVELYITPQTPYIKVQYNVVEKGKRHWKIEYRTVYRGQALYLDMYCYDGPPTQKQTSMMRGIADSAVYDERPPNGEVKTYTITDLGLKVKIPAQLITLTRGMAADDPQLKRAGMTAEQWAAQCETSEALYLRATSAYGKFEYTLRMLDDDILGKEDYASMTSEALGIVEDSYREYYAKDSDVTGFAVQPYATPTATYLVLRFHKALKDNLAYDTVQYETRRGGKIILFSFFGYDGPATLQQEEQLRNMVNSIVYAAHPVATATATPAALSTPSSSPPPAVLSAMGGSHTLAELGLRLTLPDDLVVFGQSVDPKDPNLLMLDLDAQELQTYHLEQNVYLDAIEVDCAYAIEAARCTGEEAKAFEGITSLTAETAQTVEDALWPAYTALEAKKLDIGRYETDQAIFLRVSYELPQSDPPYCAVEYLTLHEDRVIRLSLFSYEGPVTLEQKKRLKAVVDTAVLDTPHAPAVAAATPKVTGAPLGGTVYVDGKAGVRFVVPESWTRSTSFLRQSPLDVKYTSDGSTIAFSTMDFWQTYSQEEKEGLAREDINSDLVTLNQVSGALESAGLSVSSIEYETIDGIRYFRAQVELQNSRVYSLLNMDQIVHAHIQDGWLYVFQFLGKKDSPAYSDYLAVLSSAQYGDDIPEDALAAQDAALRRKNNWLPAIGGVLRAVARVLLSIVATLLVYAAPVLVYRHGLRKAPVPKAMATKLTVLYGVLALLVAVLHWILRNNAAPTAAVLLWSYGNYRILRGGKALRPQPGIAVQPSQGAAAEDTNASGSQAPQAPAAPGSIRYCVKCGTKLPSSGFYCSCCGAKIKNDVYM